MLFMHEFKIGFSWYFESSRRKVNEFNIHMSGETLNVRALNEIDFKADLWSNLNFRANMCQEFSV